MKLPQINLDGLTAPVPIVQGAMGIGVSGSSLAAAVAIEAGRLLTYQAATLKSEGKPFSKEAAMCAPGWTRRISY